jgi:hypothetical protein
MASSPATSKVTPAGWTDTLKVMGWAIGRFYTGWNCAC